MPILVRNSTSFEERIMAANPEAAAPVELQPCDTCGRKFNPTALERHAKVRSTPRFYCFTFAISHLETSFAWVELFARKGES